MNHIYRLVWNTKRRMLMAVAEVGNAHGKDGVNDTCVGRAVAGATEPFQGARKVLAAAVIALFPLASFAQGAYYPDEIAEGDAITLLDSDGTNAAAANWRLKNNGQLLIGATDNGTSLLSLSGSGSVLLGDRTLHLTSAQDVYQGTIQGAGGFSVDGGNETLEGTHTYTGATAVARDAGLWLSGSGSIAFSSGLLNNGYFDIAATDNGAQVQSLSGSGSVWLGGQTLTLTQANDVFAGVVDGYGGMTVAGGTQVLSAANTYTGVTAIGEQGRLVLSDSGAVALSGGVLNNGMFDIAAANNGGQVQSLSGSGAVLLGGQTLTLTNAHDEFGGVIHGWGGVTIAAGQEVLSGANTYTGATSVDAWSKLSLSGSGSIAASSGLLNNGVFDIAATDNGAAVQSLSGSGSVMLGGQTLTLTGANDEFAGVIDGWGGVKVAGGYEILSGANTYTGATSVDAWSTLILSGSGSIADSSGLLNNGVFDIAATNAGAQVQSLSGSGTVLLGGQTLTLTNARDEFAGVIDGWGGVKIAGGYEILSGANTYTGATSIDAWSTLVLSGSGSIADSSGLLNNGVFDIAATNNGAQVQSLSGSGAVLLGGQTLTLTNARDEFAGVIEGAGGLSITGGREILSGANTYTGATSIDYWSALELSGSGSIAASSGLLNNGVFDIAATNNGAELQSLSGSGTVLLGGQNLTLSGAHDAFAGTIDGWGGVKIAGGYEVLSGANTYTGVTSVDERATLILSGSGSIADSNGLLNNGVFDIATTNNGAQLQSLSGSGAVLLGGRTLTLTNAHDEFAGVIAGAGGLAIAGGREILSGANTYGGATSIDAWSTLELSGSGSIAASSGLLNNGVFDIAATNNGAAVQSLSGSGAVLLGGQTLTLTNAHDAFAGVIEGAGGLRMTGGRETLSGANTYTGATTLNGWSTLELSGSGSIAASSGLLNNGVFDIAATDNGAQVRSLSGSGAVLLGGQTLTLTGADGQFAGAIHGSGGLAIAGGYQALSGANTYTGATSTDFWTGLELSGSGSIAASSGLLNNGVFDIAATNNGAQVQSLSGSGTVLLGGQTLTLTNARDGFAGAIHGSGDLAIAGGHETLGGVNAYTGATSVGLGASLELSGSGSIAASSGLLNNGVFDIAATDNGAEVQSLSGSGTVLLGDQTLTLTGAHAQFAGTIHGSGGLAITSGHEILAGTNTYTGATSIGTQSVLELSGSGSIAASSGLLNNGILDIAATSNGAELQSLHGSGAVLLGGQTLTLAQAQGEFAGTLHGSGGLLIAGGTQALTTAQYHTGTTTVATGAALALDGAASIAGSAVRSDGRFDIAGAAGDVGIRSLSGSGSVLLGANDLVLSAAEGSFNGAIGGSGGVSVLGGKQALEGVNTYTGKTIVRGGTLRTVADANLGRGDAALELDNGTWQTGADLTHERGLLLSGRGTVDVDAGTTTVEGGAVNGSGALVKQGSGTLILRGVLGNSGGLQVAKGTLALTAVNTYTGGTTVSQGGTLRINNDAALGAAGNGLTLDGGTLQTTGSMESARSIALTANNGTLDTEGADSIVTWNGNISGDGRLVKEGAGTLVLGGDNGGGKGSDNVRGDGWTGGLTINDGLVKVTHAYGLGWGSVLTFNAGRIVTTVDIATGQDIHVGRTTEIYTETGTTTTLAGNLLSGAPGNGCFTKTGLGTLNVTGTASIDATCVMEGKLLANGNYTSQVTVARGATLGGSGTVKGDLLVRGTLSPGNSPGMLTADANVTMATGSTYKEDIGGTVQASAASPVGAAGYYSYLNVVNGKRFVIEPGVTLAPTLANLYTPDESGYGSAPLAPQLGQTFRIVTADGGIVGRFDTVAQPAGLAGMRMAAFYNVGGSNSIELKVLPASYAGWLAGGNGNLRSAGAALDSIAALDESGRSSAQQNALLYRVASYDATRLAPLVRGLSGEVHGALAAAAPQAGWDLERSVLKHGGADDGRALWLDLTGNRGKWSSDDAASGFHTDRVQLTLGLDVLHDADTRIGLGFSAAHTDLDAVEGSGKLRQNKLFVYGERAMDGVVVDAIGAFGRDKADSQRSDPFNTGGAALGAHVDGKSSLLGLGLRSASSLAGTTLAPFARVTVQKAERDGALESGESLAALALGDYSATGTRLVTGLTAASRNSDPLQASTYRFNLGVGVDSGDLLRPRLGAALSDAGMAVGAPQVGRGFVQGGVNGTLQIRKGAYVYFGLSGEARSGYYQAGGNAGVRAVF